MGRIYGREIHVLHRIVLVPYPHRPGGKIYLVQQVAVRHPELLAPADYLPLQLELDYGYRLVHLGNEADCLLVEGGTRVQLRLERGAGVVTVGVHGEGS